MPCTSCVKCQIGNIHGPWMCDDCKDSKCPICGSGLQEGCCWSCALRATEDAIDGYCASLQEGGTHDSAQFRELLDAREEALRHLSGSGLPVTRCACCNEPCVVFDGGQCEACFRYNKRQEEMAEARRASRSTVSRPTSDEDPDPFADE